MPKLPPTARDLEIYESVHIQNVSTWHMAERHHISQTRVRQIIRRVVEWLGEVIPPQAKLGKEHELYLALQIAADRFQHQLEEVATLWQDTRESKYAGIRIRLTTAQARLGVVGGVAAGLLADAADGIDVPAYVPPAEPQSNRHTPCAEPNALEHGCPDLAQKSDERNPAFDLRHAKFDYDHQKALRAPHRPRMDSHIERAARALRNAGYQLNEDFGSCDQTDEHASSSFSLQPSSFSSPPPPGDCSPFDENSPLPETAVAAEFAETSDLTTTCDDDSADPNTVSDSATTTSQPLLTKRDPSPVTELQIAPNQPGATVSTIKQQPELTTDAAPCLSSPAT